MDKADSAFLTIGELARELGVAQHILRYWETRFPQLRPIQRSGNRRYYRPGDVDVARRINSLLNEEGFTVKGAQRVLSGKAARGKAPEAANGASNGASTPAAPAAKESAAAAPPAAAAPTRATVANGMADLFDGLDRMKQEGSLRPADLALLIARLTVIRENLQAALDTE